MTEDASQYVSVTTAHQRLKLSRARIQQAIEDGQVRATYPNLWAVRVHWEDCQKLLATPPAPKAPRGSKTPAAQQAA